MSMLDGRELRLAAELCNRWHLSADRQEPCDRCRDAARRIYLHRHEVADLLNRWERQDTASASPAGLSAQDQQ